MRPVFRSAVALLFLASALGADSGAGSGTAGRPESGDRNASRRFGFTTTLYGLTRAGGGAAPRRETPAGLVQRRPYERGKVPVVFIHGLWSQPRSVASDDRGPRGRAVVRAALPVLDLRLLDRRPDPVLGRPAEAGPRRRARRRLDPVGPTRPSTGWSWSATAWAACSPR